MLNAFCATPFQSLRKQPSLPPYPPCDELIKPFLPLHQPLHHYLEKHGKRASPSTAIYGIPLRTMIRGSQIIYYKILECFNFPDLISQRIPTKNSKLQFYNTK